MQVHCLFPCTVLEFSLKLNSQSQAFALASSAHVCFDYRYHLQAFRHLYVLAAELRTVLPRDVDTGIPCYVPMEIIFKVTFESFVNPIISFNPIQHLPEYQ